MRDQPSHREIQLFDEQVVQPVLARLAQVEPRIASRSARELLVGTAQAESALLHGLQVPNGPARGRFQIEPGTMGLVGAWLERPENRRFVDPLDDLLPLFVAMDPVTFDGAQLRALSDHVCWNDFLGCGLARLLYWSWPDPLARPGDWRGHAAAWKKMYNTAHGKGSPESFLARNRSVIAYFETVRD